MQHEQVIQVRLRFRRGMIDRCSKCCPATKRPTLAGEAIKDLTAELGISGSTLLKWRRQAQIDAGRRPGVLSYQADPLAQARRRIKELEDELEITKLASELYEHGKSDPKASTRLSEG
jgi:transposase-like protein